MHQTRYKNLNLLTIRFPLPAIVSILHRISGFFLFLCIPFLLWGLQFSLTPAGYETFQNWHQNSVINCIFWILFVPFLFHLVAGIRHLLTDVQLGVSLKGGKRGALLTVLIAIILIVLAGIWLW